jgi:hypothetical protein
VSSVALPGETSVRAAAGQAVRVLGTALCVDHGLETGLRALAG